LGFFFEFPKRGVRAIFSALEDPAWQRPLRLTTCDKEDSLTSAADDGGALLQTGLLLIAPDILEVRTTWQRIGRYWT